MDYTQSSEFVTHAGTGNRMHNQNQAVPTVVSDKDLNAVNWSLMELVKAAGLAGQQFDPGTPATYQVVRNAMAELLRRGYGTVGAAGGTGDAITLTLSPPPVALVDGMTVRVRAAAANTVAAPTLAIGTLAAKPIVKGNGVALSPADIAGAGQWIDLRFDALTDKWVLLNPFISIEAAFSGANQSRGTNGYQKLPGGLIIQWGQVTGYELSTWSNAGQTMSKAFPVVFPLAFAGVPLTVQGIAGPLDGSAEAQEHSVSALSWASTGFNAHVTRISGAAGSTADVFNVSWLALGVAS